MLEQLELTDDERAAFERDRDALTTPARRLSDAPMSAGLTLKKVGMNAAFISLTTLTDSLTRRPPASRSGDG